MAGVLGLINGSSRTKAKQPSDNLPPGAKATPSDNETIYILLVLLIIFVGIENSTIVQYHPCQRLANQPSDLKRYSEKGIRDLGHH